MLKLSTNTLRSLRNNIVQLTQTLLQSDAQEIHTGTIFSEKQHFQPFYLEWLELRDIMAEIHRQELAYEENAELVQLIMETIHFELMHELLTHIPEEHHEVVVVRVHNSESLEKVLNTIDVADGLIEKRLRAKADKVQKVIILRLRDE